MTEFHSLSSNSAEHAEDSLVRSHSMRFGGAAASDEEERALLNAEETIFVAVGKDAKQSETTLLWAVKNFSGKKISLLHVHRPCRLISPSEGSDYAKQEHERSKLHKLIDEYRLIVARAGVRGNDEVLIEMDIVEEGIVEAIARHSIRWLVMGAAADEYYSERLAEIKSRKALFVCQKAASYCHIWFVCKGHLIYTREDREYETEIESAPSLLLIDCPAGTEQPKDLTSESTNRLANLDVEEHTNELEEISRRLNPLMIDEEEKAAIDSYHGVEQAIVHSKNTKQKEVEETERRWKEEDNAMEAKCKAKAFESLYTKEISQRKEMEEVLAMVRQQIDWVNKESGEYAKQVQMVQDKKSVLESQLSESQCTIKELEEKIVSAAELLISFREKRDKLQIEHRNALRKLKQLKTVIEGVAVSFSRAEFPMFSFMEINEATENFDPSLKIGEGRHGSVYKGILRHMHVAIKMLPSYGTKTQLDFEYEVEVLSRVRHSNLVTLIGTCPESRSLVYEYLKNGCLEDRLACKDNSPPLPWQLRTCIATEICSALIFIHSSMPSIVHGNLKPSSILFDANFVSKVGGLGIIGLTQNENPADFRRASNDPNGASLYRDPEYLETGKLTPESDVYSFGTILLRILTARPLLGLVKDIECALENDNIDTLLDISAGDWPLEQAKELAYLALRCCEKNPLDRPDLCVVHEAMKASYAASATRLISKKLLQTPSHFVCPIFQEVMEDPHIAADGYTYEAEAIQGWLKGHNTSPMTNLKLDHCNLVPNYALQYAIQQWQLE